MRSRHPVRGWLIAAALVLIGGGVVVALARPLAQTTLATLLNGAGVPVRTLKIRSLGPLEAEFGIIELGLSDDGPAAASARATWSVRSLLNGRVERLIIRQPQLSIRSDGDTLVVKGLPGFGERRDGGAIPLDRIDVIDGTLRASTPLGTMAANVDAAISASPRGLRLDRLRVRRARAALAGGVLSLKDALYRNGQPFDAVIRIDGIELGALLELLDVQGLSGAGDLDGQLPIHIDSGGLRIDDGRIVASGPGSLRYSGQGLPASAQAGDKSVTESIQLVRDALADFRYTSLVLGLARAASGEGTVTAKLEGANPAVLAGHPFAINIRFDANFDKLAAIVFEGYAAAGRLLRPGSAAGPSR